ncbi:MAG: rhomboid family intramembrane serine protease [Chloroflexi bacterium]|nr:rhomboid family intramembrane serine protease [Chloroflexota bacterium]MCL5074849.1 rhomboid family intramembrane serine protease [Chloroflexota bacterium]
MIPISDYVGVRRRFPLVTITIILINIAVFLYEISLSPPHLEGLIRALGLVPYEITGGIDIPPASPSPIYLTALTAMFLHGGWLHLLGNMLYLWVFGDNVEDSMGHLGFLIFYLLCGLIAAAAYVWVEANSRTPSIGASGAIAGVLAAYLLRFPRARVRVLLFLGFFVTITTVPAIFLIGLWALLQFFSGIGSLGIPAQQTGGIAYWAHIGGFAAGLVVSVFFPRQRLQR